VESTATSIREHARNYLDSLKRFLDQIPLEKVEAITDILYQAYRDNRQVFIMGNGGSASTASHFACDLGKGTIIPGKPRFRVISLNDNISLITALSNDFGYEEVFREQLMNLVNAGDIVIGITGSGNSPNVLKAMEYARSRGAVTIGFIGFDGGKLRGMVDEEITIACDNYGQVEDIHLILEHLISQFFRQKIDREG